LVPTTAAPVAKTTAAARTTRRVPVKTTAAAKIKGGKPRKSGDKKIVKKKVTTRKG
jgi:hypothetical protein